LTEAIRQKPVEYPQNYRSFQALKRYQALAEQNESRYSNPIITPLPIRKTIAPPSKFPPVGSIRQLFVVLYKRSFGEVLTFTDSPNTVL